jgi:hypothetical protein
MMITHDVHGVHCSDRDWSAGAARAGTQAPAGFHTPADAV